MIHKVKKIVVILALIFASYIIQNTISVMSGDLFVTPNVLIILVCIFGYMNGSNEAMIIGFFSGLLVDIFSSDIIGLNAILYLYVGFLSGTFNRLFYKHMITLPLVIVGAGDLLYNFGYYVIRFVLRNKLDFSYYFMKIIIPELVITVFLTLILFRLFYKINFDLLTTQEQRSRVRFD